MPIEVEGPDGTVIEFPDGTPQATIAGVMRKRYPPKATPARLAPGSPEAMWLGFGIVPPAKPKAAKPPKKVRGMVGEITGAMANVNRGLLIGDEMAAAIGAGADLVAGKYDRPRIPGGMVIAAKEAFDNRMREQRATEDDFSARRPKAAALARGVGMAPTVFVPGGSVQATSRLGMAGQMALSGAAQGAASGILDRGTMQDRIRAGQVGAAVGGATGGVLGGALGGKRVPKPVKAKPQGDVELLRSIGVEPTPGQASGGLVKNVEDLAMRAPILGPAISGARSRVNDQLNRAVALRALQPIGEKLPKGVEPGFGMVQYVDEAIGKVYDDATALVERAAPDQQFGDELAAIAQRSAELPESQKGVFERIMRDRLTRLGSGASGRQIKAIHEELGDLQAAYSKGGGGDAVLGSMIGDVRRSLMGLVGRADPRAGEMIAKADRAWVDYSILNDAAAAASAKGGVFTPSQLNTQARSAAKRLGPNMAGKGAGSLQDVAAAASRTLPDQFGSPGTANALALGAGGVGLVTEPVTTATMGVGLTVASAPYWAMGRKVIEELPASPSRSQAEAAMRQIDDLIARDPSLEPLKRELMLRLTRYSGSAGATANPPRQVPARQ